MTMFSEKMAEKGRKRSAIREIFEYALKRKEEIGADNVFDFSIGNPSVPAPEIITDTLIELIRNTDPVALHGYTSAQGDKAACKAVADYITKTFNAPADPRYIYFTSGAAAALSICLRALGTGNDEIILFAPYFPEYCVFTENAGCKNVVIPYKSDLTPDLEAFEKAISMHTKAVIINSPNNPGGMVYSEAIIKNIAEILENKSKQFGHPIFIISDEPYRELVYDNVFVPYIPNYYKNTFVCYSFSKVWSIPGERIGYIYLHPSMYCVNDLFAAVCGAGRALGYVCASSLFQKLVERCIGTGANIAVYSKNRELLYGALSEYGFDCIHPEGAFYLFVKAPEGNAEKFAQAAKKHELLIVPADSFGAPDCVRISYCVSTEQIMRSLPAFKALAEEIKAK